MNRTSIANAPHALQIPISSASPAIPATQFGQSGQTAQAPSILAQHGIKPLTDIHGLQSSGIFPTGKEPCIRTLRRWTKGRVIPSHRVGRFVYYDIDEVARHIHVKRLVPAR
jgi:hypothetical protein